MPNQITDSTQATENRLRRAARRHGYTITKSRRRSQHANDPGYMLIHSATNAVVLGGYPVEFTATLADIEGYLTV